MKEYVFNERERAEKMIETGYVDSSNITKTIAQLARYNYYVLNMKENENVKSIESYLKRNDRNYTDIGYYTKIRRCVKKVDKIPWSVVKKVIITKEELKRIRKLNDDRKEKLAFVFLADVKFRIARDGKWTGVSNVDADKAFVLARVNNVKVSDRYMFLSFMVDEGLETRELSPKFSGHNLTYVSNNDDNIALVLDEYNYKELAFTYMNWKYGGYKKCESCGLLFKTKSGAPNQKYCKKCTPRYEIIGESKTIICKDCGKEFEVSVKNNKTCRCDDCQHEYDKSCTRERVKKHRNNIKM